MIAADCRFIGQSAESVVGIGDALPAAVSLFGNKPVGVIFVRFACAVFIRNGLDLILNGIRICGCIAERVGAGRELAVCAVGEGFVITITME